MSNLVELFDNVVEFQNYNGVPLAAGKLYVFALGRTRLMDTWSDIDGESLNPNPIILDDLGQCHCYCSDDFDYTLVVCDQFDNEIFSVDKYLLSKGEHSHADVAVAPSEHIGVSSYHVGEVTVYVPYLTGEVGKIYEGIEPIVVNNDVNRISANHIPLGVQDPLYFVEDSETACILGCSAQTEIPAELSGKWDEASDAVIANSAQWAEGTEYEAGSYIDITNNTISVVNLPTSADVQNIVDVATSGLMPSGDYLTKESADTLYQPTGNYLTGLPEDLVYSADITGLATTAQLDEKLDKTDSGNFYPMEGNPSGFLTAHQSLEGYATEQWVEDKGYITGIDIQESAGWNEATTVVNNNSAIWNNTTNVVSSNSAQWGATNPQIPVTGINGIKISESGDRVVFEVSADYALADDLTGKQDSLTFGYKDTAISSIDNSALYDNSAHARINTLAGRISDLSSNKLDESAFSDVSGSFITALPQDLVYTADIQDMATTGDLTAYATVESLTAKQDAGDYLSATDSANFLLTSDSGNFYPMNQNPSGYLTAHQSLADYQTTADMVNYQTTAAMTAYQPVGDYMTTADSANFYTTANESGFISEVPAGTMNESAFEYDENDKISGYNGSAFAGGSDVPEGVMVESAVEYNAVQEISGYNGSAIAQYGAEKQWLVTDDTLLTLSNSAQFAIGVNISAVAQLLGVDETVLFNGSLTGYTSAKLSENVNNFNRVKVLFSRDNAWDVPLIDSLEMCTDVLSAQLHGNFTMNSVAVELSNMNGWCYTTVANITDDTVSAITGRNYNMAGTATFDGNFCLIKQIIGIGRKEV